MFYRLLFLPSRLNWMTQKIPRISSDHKVIFTYLLFVSLLFVCGLFNNAARVSDYVSLKEYIAMRDKLENTWHSAIMCNAPPRRLPGGNDENHKELHTGQSASWKISILVLKQTLRFKQTCCLSSCVLLLFGKVFHTYFKLKKKHILGAIILSCVLLNRNGQNGVICVFSFLASV